MVWNRGLEILLLFTLETSELDVAVGTSMVRYLWLGWGLLALQCILMR